MMATSVSLHLMSHVREADLRGVQVWGGELYTKGRSGGEPLVRRTIVAGTKKRTERKEQDTV